MCVKARLQVESGVRLREACERANVMDPNGDIPAQLFSIRVICTIPMLMKTL